MPHMCLLLYDARTTSKAVASSSAGADGRGWGQDADAPLIVGRDERTSHPHLGRLLGKAPPASAAPCVIALGSPCRTLHPRSFTGLAGASKRSGEVTQVQLWHGCV